MNSETLGQAVVVVVVVVEVVIEVVVEVVVVVVGLNVVVVTAIQLC